MNAKPNRRSALVTGGAGLIGSHVADLLLAEGWKVRILDNLEPQTHRNGKPQWVPAAADFVEGNIQDRAAITAARSRGFIAGSGVPNFAATVISRASLPNSFDFWASWRPLRCMMFLNWECPAMRLFGSVRVIWMGTAAL